MVGWFCNIFGWFLVIIGISINLIAGSRLIQSDTSDLPSFYVYGASCVYAGIILFVIGLGFFWKARQEKQLERG